MPKQMCFRHVPLERKLVKQSLLLNSTFPHHCNFHSRSTTGVNQRPRTRATLSFSTQSADSGRSSAAGRIAEYQQCGPQFGAAVSMETSKAALTLLRATAGSSKGRGIWSLMVSLLLLSRVLSAEGKKHAIHSRFGRTRQPGAPMSDH